MGSRSETTPGMPKGSLRLEQAALCLLLHCPLLTHREVTGLNQDNLKEVIQMDFCAVLTKIDEQGSLVTQVIDTFKEKIPPGCPLFHLGH